MNLRRLTLAVIASAAALASPAMADAKQTPAPPEQSKNVSLKLVSPIRGTVPSHLTPIRLSTDRPVSPELFGRAGTFASRNNVLQWVSYVFAKNIPGFRQPAVYEVAHGSTFCGAPVYNAVYCRSNQIAYSRGYAASLYRRFGEAGFAALIAHEYGHGSQQWLGLGYRGSFRYQLTGEGFADCMAGGFLAQMYLWGYVDSIGDGDYREMLYTFIDLADRVTSQDGSGHGDAAWRSAKVRYGWENGMRGCGQVGTQWANS